VEAWRTDELYLKITILSNICVPPCKVNHRNSSIKPY
jgi:hypothetical protein